MGSETSSNYSTRQFYITVSTNRREGGDFKTTAFYTLSTNERAGEELILVNIHWKISKKLSFKGVVRSIFILDILKVLIPESTLLFTRTQTEQICLRYPHPPVTSPKNGFGGIRRSVAKPLQCLQLWRRQRITHRSCSLTQTWARASWVCR